MVSVCRAEDGPSFVWSWDKPRKSQQGDLKAQCDQVITQARKEIWQQRRKWTPTEPSVKMAKASPGSTRAKSKEWGRRANVSILGQTQDGRMVAKNNPTFSLALWIVFTQHHLVQLRIQTLEVSLISTCLHSVASTGKLRLGSDNHYWFELYFLKVYSLCLVLSLLYKHEVLF